MCLIDNNGGANIKYERLTLNEKIIEFNCEWLNHLSTMNKLNIRYIRVFINIHNASRL